VKWIWTGFFTPACLKGPEVISGFRLAALLVLAGCSGTDPENRFELTRIESTWSNGQLSVTTEQRLVLSEEARNALTHGVPLTLELELALREASGKTRMGQETYSYEINYLPLSGYYQLTFSGTDAVKTFPRLRHVLADLSRLDVTVETGVVPAGEYEILARMSLDQNKMPPPMRLPVLLSTQWRHDTSWTSWPMQIDPGT